MNFDNTQYEETVDLKDLCIYMLRKWRWILLAAFACAVLVGGYKGIQTPKSVMSASDIEKAEESLEENEKSILALEKEIENRQTEILTQETSISNLEKIVITYEAALTEAQNLLDTVSASEEKLQILTQIGELNNNLLSANSDMTEARLRIRELQDEILMKQEEQEELEEVKIELEESLIATPAETSVKDIVKYAVLGSIAGAFVVCGIAFIQYFFYKQIRNAEELKERYGVRVLADLYAPSPKKNKIDTLLDRMNGFHGDVNPDQEYSLAAAGIHVMLPEKDDTQKIVVTGTVDQKILEEVCAGLDRQLPKAKYQLCLLSNPVYNAEAMLQIASYPVVWVEARTISDRREVNRLAELFQNSNTTVIGAVMM